MFWQSRTFSSEAIFLVFVQFFFSRNKNLVICVSLVFSPYVPAVINSHRSVCVCVFDSEGSFFARFAAVSRKQERTEKQLGAVSNIHTDLSPLFMQQRDFQASRRWEWWLFFLRLQSGPVQTPKSLNKINREGNVFLLQVLVFTAGLSRARHDVIHTQSKSSDLEF